MKLLIIDNDLFDINKILLNFTNENWTIDYAKSYDSSIEILKIKKYDIILCTYFFETNSKKN
jgi:hypothetical protein